MAALTDEERKALGMTRRLAFQNIVNGVPPEKVREALGLSQLELDQMLVFVRRKINGHLLGRKQPPIPCDDLREMRWNRRDLLAVLSRIGNLDLSTDLIILEKGLNPWDPDLAARGIRQYARPSRPNGTPDVPLGKFTTQALDHPEMIDGAERSIAKAYA